MCKGVLSVFLDLNRGLPVLPIITNSAVVIEKLEGEIIPQDAHTKRLQEYLMK